MCYDYVEHLHAHSDENIPTSSFSPQRFETGLLKSHRYLKIVDFGLCKDRNAVNDAMWSTDTSDFQVRVRGERLVLTMGLDEKHVQHVHQQSMIADVRPFPCEG